MMNGDDDTKVEIVVWYKVSRRNAYTSPNLYGRVRKIPPSQYDETMNQIHICIGDNDIDLDGVDYDDKDQNDVDKDYDDK